MCSGAFGFWNCGILVLLDKKNNICHGYPMCFAQAEVGNTAGKKKHGFLNYFLLVSDWRIMLILIDSIESDVVHGM